MMGFSATMQSLLRLAATAALSVSFAALPAAARDFEARQLLDRDLPSAALVRFLSGSDRFAPNRIVLTGPIGAFAADSPKRAPIARPHANRVDLSDLPLLGGTVLHRPDAALLSPSRQIGLVRRNGDALAVELSPDLPPDRAARLLAAPPRLLTEPPFVRRLVSLELPRLERDDAAEGPARAGAVIGAVYDAGDALLIAPPRESLFGLDPLFR